MSRIALAHPARCTADIPADLSSDNLIAEEKLDGSRYVLYIGGDPYERHSGSALLSRRESSIDKKYVDKADNVPHITKIQYNDCVGSVLDGEIMSSDFLSTNSIMNSSPVLAIEKQRQHGKLSYYVFDILFYRGRDVRHLSLAERRLLLEETVASMNNPFVVEIPQIKLVLREYFSQIVKGGGEGVIIKDLSRPYGEGWSKMKKSFDVSCIVSGYKTGVSGGKYRELIGSIALSVVLEGKLVEVGFASGFSDRLRIEMSESFEKFRGRVVDVFAQEIQYGKGSKTGRLRHPTFHRFRDDVTAESCTYQKLIADLKPNKAREDRK